MLTTVVVMVDCLICSHIIRYLVSTTVFVFSFSPILDYLRLLSDYLFSPISDYGQVIYVALKTCYVSWYFLVIDFNLKIINYAK